MGFPNIPNISPIISVSREDAISLVVASIAMEELSLSHIMNAEGEKLQALLAATPTASVSDLLAINSSVQSMLETVMSQEAMLSAKLSSALQATDVMGPPGPTGATGPAGGPMGPTGPAGLLPADFAQFSGASGPWPIAPPFTPVPVSLANNDLIVGTAITHTPGTPQINLAPGSYQITWEVTCNYQHPNQQIPGPPVAIIYSYSFAGGLFFNGTGYAPSARALLSLALPGQSIGSTTAGDASTGVTLQLTSTSIFVAPVAGVLELDLTPVAGFGGFFQPQNQSFSNATLSILKIG